MAVIGDKNGVNAEIKFTENRYGYIHYSFRFFCGDKPLFNPEVMRADFIDAHEYDDDNLIPTLEKVLITNESADWWPLEPDLSIEIQTDKTRNSFDLTFLIDGIQTKPFLEAYQAFGGDNPAVRINLNRSEFEKFIANLKKDYQEYLERSKETTEYYQKGAVKPEQKKG